MGILGSLLGKREPRVQYRTIDGGHPAPYPDMTDEQLYNYEVTFNVPQRTFDSPPKPAKPARPPREGTTILREPTVRDPVRTEKNPRHAEAHKTRPIPERTQPPQQEKTADGSRYTATMTPEDAPKPVQLPPLDLSKPVRLITSKQPVEIITTRARHPVYKVHAYIGNDDVVTLFTLDGRLTENGPRFLENVPQRQQLYLNIYPGNADAGEGERFQLTQHATKQDAEAAAKPGRIVCVTVQFDM